MTARAHFPSAGLEGTRPQGVRVGSLWGGAHAWAGGRVLTAVRGGAGGARGGLVLPRWAVEGRACSRALGGSRRGWCSVRGCAGAGGVALGAGGVDGPGPTLWRFKGSHSPRMVCGPLTLTWTECFRSSLRSAFLTELCPVTPLALILLQYPALLCSLKTNDL
ncbi:uncharacterized protein LOC144291726 [Canis aureus]